MNEFRLTDQVCSVQKWLEKIEANFMPRKVTDAPTHSNSVQLFIRSHHFDGEVGWDTVGYDVQRRVEPGTNIL